jgi:hypothetical protein
MSSLLSESEIDALFAAPDRNSNLWERIEAAETFALKRVYPTPKGIYMQFPSEAEAAKFYEHSETKDLLEHQGSNFPAAKITKTIEMINPACGTET